jgi:hypothetical protein
MTTWVDPTTDADLIDGLWKDAPLDPTVLAALLGSAQVQCETFAPALADDAEVPDNYRLAVILQARALSTSTVAGGSDQMGSDFPVRVFPMDWTVKALLRPTPGVPGVW